MKKYPEGFPLKPIDIDGNKISEGDEVRILIIPEWILQDLDSESAQIVKACEGTTMVIYEIDDYGYAWVEKISLSTEQEYESNSFSMEPSNLRKL